MNESQRNTMVGVFVLGGLLALGTLIVLYGKGQGLIGLGGAIANQVSIRFETAYGIKAGNPVNIYGIKVGQVQSVSFTNPARYDQGVTVLVQLEPGVKLHRGATASTSEPGFGMGRPPIEIRPGAPEADYLASGEIINGSTRGAMESMIPPALISTVEKTAAQLGDVSVALTPVLNDLHDMLQSREPAVVDAAGGPRGNLSSAATRLDLMLKNFNQVIGDPSVQSQFKDSLTNLNKMSVDGAAAVADFRQAGADFKQIAADGKDLVHESTQAVTNIDQRTQDVAQALTHDLDLASRFLENLNVASDKMNRGEGSLGLLLNDQRLYEAMTLTFRRLAETAGEFGKVAQQWQEGKIKVAF